jgi:hypothetical protein
MLNMLQRNPHTSAIRNPAFFELPLLEREREFSKLLQWTKQKKSVLLCGWRGLGKTRLLWELRRELTADGEEVLYVPVIQPLHAFLAKLAVELALKCNSKSSIALRGVLWDALESSPKVILLDDIEEPSLAYYRFFERILYVPGMVLIGSVVQPHATGALHRIFWNPQTTVSLRPLSRQAAAILVEKAIHLFTPDLAHDSAFQEQVIQAARGNPGRIVEMCRRAADPAYRDGDRIRFAALSMDSFAHLVM